MRKKFTHLRLRLERFRRIGMPAHKRQMQKASRHPSFRVPVITLGVLLVVSLSAYWVARQTDKLPPSYDAKVVILSYDGKEQTVPVKTGTVGELIRKLDIKINEGDVVEPANSTRINQDQFRINIYRAMPIQVVENGSRTFAYSAAKTPRAAAQQAGANLYPEDRIKTIPVDDFVKTGAISQQVVISRATPVQVDLYGTMVTLRTQAKTVAGLMREKGIKLDKDDKVSPAPETSITGLDKVSFLRTGIKTETRAEQIAMPEQIINDPNLAYGTTAIRQQGAPGEQVVTYQVTLVNNVETGRSVIQKVVSREPVTQVKVMGSSLSGIKGDMARAGIAPGDFTYVDYIVSKESGWNPAARNPSGAFGLCQALPGSKMSSAGADWATNPVTQLRWCNGYAKSRYGSWAAAYSYWQSNRYW